jgi:hypothetical protein
VGVLDQPELSSYVVEMKPILGPPINDCDANAPWMPAGPAVVPEISLAAGSPLSTSVTVPPDTCVRLTTRFGRIPSQVFRTTPVTAATRNLNRFDAQAGNFGDMGYEVSSDPPTKVGGNLLSDRPIMRSAAISTRNLVVQFETLAEIEVLTFDVVGRDRRGMATVLASVVCSECSSGIGADYRLQIPLSVVKSAKSVMVVAQPSGAGSEEIEIARPRPSPPARPARDSRR